MRPARNDTEPRHGLGLSWIDGGLHARCTEYWQPRRFTKKKDGIYTVYDGKQGGEAL